MQPMGRGHLDWARAVEASDLQPGRNHGTRADECDGLAAAAIQPAKTRWRVVVVVVAVRPAAPSNCYSPRTRPIAATGDAALEDACCGVSSPTGRRGG